MWSREGSCWKTNSSNQHWRETTARPGGGSQESGNICINVDPHVIRTRPLPVNYSVPTSDLQRKLFKYLLTADWPPVRLHMCLQSSTEHFVSDTATSHSDELLKENVQRGNRRSGGTNCTFIHLLRRTAASCDFTHS